MQASGITPPILNLKSLTPGKAQGYPGQDQFQSLLQSRIVSRGYGSSSSRSADRSSWKSQLRQARPVSSSSTSTMVNDRSKWGSTRSAMVQEAKNRASRLQVETRSMAERLSGKSTKDSPALATAVAQPNTEMPALLKGLTEFLNQQPGQCLKVSPDQLQELKAFLQQAGLPAAQVDRLLNADTFQTKGLTAQNVQAAWQEAAKISSQQALAAQLGQATSSQLANTSIKLDLPPALKALMDSLNQQPEQALKVPPDRLSQVQGFLLQAGIPPAQVKNLLNSPQVQEQGLTAANVQAAWQKGIQSTLKQALAASGSQLTAVQNLTNQPDYQRLWQNLTLPPQVLGDLRLELQKLGVPAESLTGLNQQNFPNGVPLAQVWELIQKSVKSSSGATTNDAATLNKVSNSTPLLEGEKDLGKWRQLLTQAGMDPELVQTLTSGFTPTNRGELQTTLAQMAPSSTPQGQEIPKPLYLPGGVRVRQVPLLQQADTGQGKEDANGNLGQNLGSLPQAQIANLAGATPLNTGASDFNNFLAYFNSNSTQLTDPAGAQAATGGQASAVNSYLTPEAREALWSQVQSGVLGNLRPGENQVTLTLNPPDLGKLDLTLNLKGQTVEVTAITSHSAVAEAAAAGVQQLAQALNQQGLILTQFQFHHQDEAAHSQSQFAFSQNSGDQRQNSKKESDKWEQPPPPRRQRWAGGGIDCFA